MYCQGVVAAHYNDETIRGKRKHVQCAVIDRIRNDAHFRYVGEHGLDGFHAEALFQIDMNVRMVTQKWTQHAR